MTIKEAKIRAIIKLKRSSGKEAAIDAEILLAHALGISREELLAHDERPVPSFALRRFDSLIARRAKHEPVAYLTGHKEFFGLQFSVNKYTLIPRPETELIVEEALLAINNKTQQPNYKKYLNGKSQNSKVCDSNPIVIDVGTGSGVIAIAIAKNAPDATVIATDISKPALKLAELNAQTNDVDDRIIFERANLLNFKIPRPRNFESMIITANLPYLPTKVWQKCSPDVKKFEPKTALIGGKDGLKYYDDLFHQVIGLNIKATIICEIDPSQKRSFSALATRHFPKARVVIKNDLAGLARVAIIS